MTCVKHKGCDGLHDTSTYGVESQKCLPFFLPSFPPSLFPFLFWTTRKKNKNLQNIISLCLLIFSPLTITFNADNPAQCLKVSTPAKLDDYIWGHPQCNAHLSFLSQHRTNTSKKTLLVGYFFWNFISAVLLSATLLFLKLMRQCRPHLSAEQICNNLRKVIYFGFFDMIFWHPWVALNPTTSFA